MSIDKTAADEVWKTLRERYDAPTHVSANSVCARVNRRILRIVKSLDEVPDPESWSEAVNSDYADNKRWIPFYVDDMLIVGRRSDGEKATVMLSNLYNVKRLGAVRNFRGMWGGTCPHISPTNFFKTSRWQCRTKIS